MGGKLADAVEQPPTVFAAVGGQGFFDALVDRFYDAVEADELLRPMYPPDMGPSRHRLAGFLAQYWGGPADYSAERGHPRLRMRHMPFAIGQAERDTWMRHMLASLEAAELPDGSKLPADIASAMFSHFDNAATHLINKPS
ncbi:globin [Candidatus Poriferisodalis sp.]|uniref:globin domain-containing protein n=1 Tax=Candidatus Poriferisodalis sp. TaxID=3101277 RepID=UPI003B013E7A